MCLPPPSDPPLHRIYFQQVPSTLAALPSEHLVHILAAGQPCVPSRGAGADGLAMTGLVSSWRPRCRAADAGVIQVAQQTWARRQGSAGTPTAHTRLPQGGPPPGHSQRPCGGPTTPELFREARGRPPLQEAPPKLPLTGPTKLQCEALARPDPPGPPPGGRLALTRGRGDTRSRRRPRCHGRWRPEAGGAGAAANVFSRAVRAPSSRTTRSCSRPRCCGRCRRLQALGMSWHSSTSSVQY